MLVVVLDDVCCFARRTVAPSFCWTFHPFFSYRRTCPGTLPLLAVLEGIANFVDIIPCLSPEINTPLVSFIYYPGMYDSISRSTSYTGLNDLPTLLLSSTVS